MRIMYDELENAHLFVSGGPKSDNRVIVSRKTGDIYYLSEEVEADEPPEDVENTENYIEIPHKHDLNLGNELVHRFVAGNLPEATDDVYDIFRRKGAHGKFKDLLEEKGLLTAWYDFENGERERALREWCRENGVEVIG